MARAENIVTQEKMGEAINSGNLDLLDDVMSPDVVDHDPAPTQGPGAEGFKAFFTELGSAFPDAKVEVETMVADDEHVAIAYTLTGTHEGDFQGISPTHKPITARGMQISRFNAEGKMVERWGSSDELGILKQLGAPLPAG